MPSRASSTITSSTSLTISGSSAEVGSSNSMTFGRMASARAMATRCLLAAGQLGRHLGRLRVDADTGSANPSARRSASFLSMWRTLMGARVTFSRIVLLANRLNDWNTVPTSARSCASCLPSWGSALPSMRMSPDSPVSKRFMVRHIVDLPEPGGPHDDEHFALVDGQVDVFQYVEVAEVLFHVRYSSTRGRPVGSLPGTSGTTGSIAACFSDILSSINY